MGMGLDITRDTTLRLPIYLTLITAILTLMTTLKMSEADTASKTVKTSDSISTAFGLVWQAGLWIFRTPFVLGLILFGLLYDSVTRMILTMASQYYRIIEVPEALFGILGSALALFGFVIPGIARRLSERRSPLFNLVITAVFIAIGLTGMTFTWPWVGVLPALILFSNMYLIGFFLSHYLNQVTTSDKRATVLSFKGLFLNLGYGLIGIFYSLLLAFLRNKRELSEISFSEETLKNLFFVDSLPWFCGYFLICLIALLVFFVRIMKKSNLYESSDQPQRS